MSKIPVYYDPSFHNFYPDYNNRKNFTRDNQDSYVVQINSVTRIVDIVSISKEGKEKLAALEENKRQKSEADVKDNSDKNEDLEIKPEDPQIKSLSNKTEKHSAAKTAPKMREKPNTALYAENMYKLNSSLY